MSASDKTTVPSRSDFERRVQHWAMKIGVQPKRIYVQPMRNKWASCSTAGRVYFSTDILHQNLSFQDSVIAHELLHLLVPNHGALFKSLLYAYLQTADGAREKRIACSRIRDADAFLQKCP